MTGMIHDNNLPNEERRGFLKTAGLGRSRVAQWRRRRAALVTRAAQTTPAAHVGAAMVAVKAGTGDEAGSTNHCTPQKVLDTARYIKDGKIYKLAATTSRRCQALASAHS